MDRVYKYVGPRPDSPIVFSIDLPYNYKPLKWGMQNGRLCLWARVNANSPEPAGFLVLGTGYDIPEGLSLEYQDSVFDGNYVWHIFRIQ